MDFENTRQMGPDQGRTRGARLHGAEGQARHKLRIIEDAAVTKGHKLTDSDRLKAAWHLRRAWHQANGAGLKQAEFADRILKGLKRPHARRETFKLANYLLPQRYETAASAKEDLAKGNKGPLRGLEPYLVGIGVAATWCGADPDAWKLDFLQETTLWERSVRLSSPLAPDDRPMETLAVLVSTLCKHLAERHDLKTVYAALKELSCRWEMFEDRLVPAAIGSSMEWVDSPISPVFGKDVSYFEESMPYPSVPLLRVDYLVGEPTVCLAPEEVVRAWDCEASDSLLAQLFGQSGKLDGFPDGTPHMVTVKAIQRYQREIRLCIVPDGHGGFAPALESRPRSELVLPDNAPIAGTWPVQATWEPAFGRPLFYARHADGGPVLPAIRTPDGQVWRVALKTTDQEEVPVQVRAPETTTWEFDADPVGAPGLVEVEPWYLSYTPATPAYLAHWLTKDWTLGMLSAACPWGRFADDHGADLERYNRDVPPDSELKFPHEGPAHALECCLHNGLLEEALSASAAQLADQVAALRRDWETTSDMHVQQLLNRWSTPPEKES